MLEGIGLPVQHPAGGIAGADQLSGCQSGFFQEVFRIALGGQFPSQFD